MTRPANPVQNVPIDPENTRYGGPAENPGEPHERYREHHPGGGPADRGPCGTYTTLPTTLEEEASLGGWKPGDRPSGGNLIRLYTLGMRGEPGFDDDPSPIMGQNIYRDTGPQIDTGDVSSSWD